MCVGQLVVELFGALFIKGLVRWQKIFDTTNFDFVPLVSNKSFVSKDVENPFRIR